MSDTAKFFVKLVQDVRRPAKAASGAMAELIRSFRKTASEAKVANRALGGAFDVFKGTLATHAALKVGDMAIAAARAGAEFVTFGQNSRLAFQQLAKHGTEPEKLFTHARLLARHFGLDLIDTTNAYRDFLKLQFTPEGADDLIRMGADLRALGANAEDVKGIFRALGQIKANKTLQGDELMQLAERGVDKGTVWEEIGKALGGKSAEEVRKLQEQGKISAEVAIEAVKRTVNRTLGQTKLGESGKRFADTTITGIFGRAKAIAQDRGVALFEQITAPFTKLAGSALTRFETFVTSREGVAAVDSIARSLGGMVTVVRDLASAFGAGFGGVWEQLTAGAGALREMFGAGQARGASVDMLQFARALGEAAAVSVGVAAAFVRVGMGVAGLATLAWETGKGILDGLVRPFGEAVGGIVQWFDTLSAIWNDKTSSFVEKAWMMGKEIVSGLARGIQGAIDLPFEAISGVVGGAISGAKRALGIRSPSRVFEGIGQLTAEGYAVGLARGSRSIGSEFQSGDIWGPASGPLATRTLAPAMGVGSSSSVVFSPTIHVTVQAGGGEARDTGSLIAREVERALEGMFRRAAMEA